LWTVGSTVPPWTAEQLRRFRIRNALGLIAVGVLMVGVSGYYMVIGFSFGLVILAILGGLLALWGSSQLRGALRIEATPPSQSGGNST
jgi:hypothetical protein